jgi:hypothetical protein
LPAPSAEQPEALPGADIEIDAIDSDDLLVRLLEVGDRKADINVVYVTSVVTSAVGTSAVGSRQSQSAVSVGSPVGSLCRRRL